MAADRIENRLDVDQAKAERTGRDEERFGTGDAFDARFRTARRSRRAAAPLGRYAVTANTPARAAAQRLVGAIEQSAHAAPAGSAAAASNSAGSLATADAMSLERGGDARRSPRGPSARRAPRPPASSGPNRARSSAMPATAATAAQTRPVRKMRRSGRATAAVVHGDGGGAGAGASRELAASAGAGVSAGSARRGGVPLGCRCCRARGPVRPWSPGSGVLRRQMRRRGQEHFLVLGPFTTNFSDRLCRHGVVTRGARWRRRTRSRSDRSGSAP